MLYLLFVNTVCCTVSYETDLIHFCVNCMFFLLCENLFCINNICLHKGPRNIYLRGWTGTNQDGTQTLFTNNCGRVNTFSRISCDWAKTFLGGWGIIIIKKKIKYKTQAIIAISFFPSMLKTTDTIQKNVQLYIYFNSTIHIFTNKVQGRPVPKAHVVVQNSFINCHQCIHVGFFSSISPLKR